MKWTANREVDAVDMLPPPMLDRELDQLGLPFDLQLALQIEPVRLDRAHRQPVCCAICLLDSPSASASRMSRSRGVNRSSGDAVALAWIIRAAAR